MQRFIKPLRTANPPILPSDILEEFIDDVFGNILDLRECNRRLLEVMYVRQREQAPVIQRIGDVFLGAAAEFRLAYPTYVGHLPLAEKRMKDEIENNPEFRIFLEVYIFFSPSNSYDLIHQLFPFKAMLTTNRTSSRFPSSGSKALPESSIGTSTEIPSPFRSYHARDCGR
jgi:RhoGEF domain